MKFTIPILTAILVAILTASGSALYRHETAILGLGRTIEKLSIKDYRQHRDILRQRVRRVGDSVSTLDAILDQDGDAFGPNGRLILRQRKEALDESRSLLENYVEENKHSGSKD